MEPAIRDVELSIPEGELVLVIGRTGAGKSTLLKAINGLVPHFTGGTLAGRVTVDGRDTRSYPPRELADVVGYVGQDPLAGFVTDSVEEELAYAMESLGVSPTVMRRRVEDILDSLGLTGLRQRPLRTLSSGEQQRVAIGSVLTAGARVLVLDEPTSALDPPAAEDVLAALTRLVHDLGVTVVAAEHRLERVIQYADRVVHVDDDGRVHDTTPGGRNAKQHRRAARRRTRSARAVGAVAALGARCAPCSRCVARAAGHHAARRHEQRPAIGEPVVSVRKLQASLRRPHRAARYRPARTAGRDRRTDGPQRRRQVDAARPPGRAEQTDSGPRHSSRAATRYRSSGSELVRDIGLVPQEPADLFWADTVDDECAGAAGPMLARFSTGSLLGSAGRTHPRDLSEGQRLALALALVLAGKPAVLLLDEPTRGLDYPGKARLVQVLRELAAEGTAVILATHDVELAAEVSHRTVVLADGEIVADGPTREVVTASPAFAPQIAKILAPLPWLTVAQVRATLAVTP